MSKLQLKLASGTYNSKTTFCVDQPKKNPKVQHHSLNELWFWYKLDIPENALQYIMSIVY